MECKSEPYFVCIYNMYVWHTVYVWDYDQWLNNDLEFYFILSFNVPISALIDSHSVSIRALLHRCVLFIQLCNNPPCYCSIVWCWLKKWSCDGELGRLVLYSQNPSWLYTGGKRLAFPVPWCRTVVCFSIEVWCAPMSNNTNGLKTSVRMVFFFLNKRRLSLPFLYI